MSKITFRADDDLVEQLESLDVSKSEALREALRAYLEEPAPTGRSSGGETTDGTVTAIDDLVRDRVDELVAAHLDEPAVRARECDQQDVNVTITLEGASVASADESAGPDRVAVTEDRSAGPAEHGERDRRCGQCGERVDADHVYCPNCGEKAARRLFCDCGDELRSDWAFCPSCGRRTPAADVLESG